MLSPRPTGEADRELALRDSPELPSGESLMANDQKRVGILDADRVCANPSIECKNGDRLRCASIGVEADIPLGLAAMMGMSPVHCTCKEACSRFPANKDEEDASDHFVPAETLSPPAKMEVEDAIEMDAIIDEDGALHDDDTYLEDLRDLCRRIKERHAQHPEYWPRKA